MLDLTSRLGFPASAKVPMRVVRGHQVPDINALRFRASVCAALLERSQWTGAQLRWIRLSNNHLVIGFADLLGLGVAQVADWDSDEPVHLGAHATNVVKTMLKATVDHYMDKLASLGDLVEVQL